MGSTLVLQPQQFSSQSETNTNSFLSALTTSPQSKQQPLFINSSGATFSLNTGDQEPFEPQTIQYVLAPVQSQTMVHNDAGMESQPVAQTNMGLVPQTVILPAGTSIHFDVKHV